jgi:hypothetical protein
MSGNETSGPSKLAEITNTAEFTIASIADSPLRKYGFLDLMLNLVRHFFGRSAFGTLPPPKPVFHVGTHVSVLIL